jgi:regulator of protease activity HflC (stomatin/prohibitin superfamily)
MVTIPAADALLPVLLGIVGLAMLAWLILSQRKPLVVYEWNWALLFRGGKFVRVLKPGLYRFFQPPSTWMVLDKRMQTMSVPGQEVLTKDALGIKLTLHAEYQIEDPVRLIKALPAWTQAEVVGAIYPLIQLPIREAVAEHTLDELLQNRDMLPERVMIAASARLADTGVKLTRVAVRDIMIPASLRDAFAAATIAQKQGVASLERARAEVASMRALANAARMAQDHPALLQLRALQAVQASEGKNTLVLDLSGQGVPLKPATLLGEDEKPD